MWVLTGCRKGAVPAALVADGPAAARRELRRLVEAFGRDRVLVELWDHGDPLDSARNDALAELAARTTSSAWPPATPTTPRRANASWRRRWPPCGPDAASDELDPWLPAAAGAHLRSGAEQAPTVRPLSGVVERAAEIGRAAAFDLSLVAPDLPPFPCPDGLTEMQYLRHVIEEGGRRRYGERTGLAGGISPCGNVRGRRSTASWR